MWYCTHFIDFISSLRREETYYEDDLATFQD